MLTFKGIQKTTLIDYRNEIACTLFLDKCNFRCSYCYNPDLVLERNLGVSITGKEILQFLEDRKFFLSGVCITGGEPLMHAPDLLEFLRDVKKIGYKIKLDTNGSFPEHLEAIINDGLVDYIAMDIKASLDKYKEVANVPVNIDKIIKSIKLIKESGILYEFRTTVFSGLNSNDFEEIGKLLSGSSKYYLQQIK